MRTKVVVKVCMNDERSRSKALNISVSVSGVESASLKGDQLEVEGDCIDAVQLTQQLRKRMVHAVLVSVGEVKKEETPAEAKTDPEPNPQPVVVCEFLPPCDGFISYPVYEGREPCTIM